jgi:hypothetical protein
MEMSGQLNALAIITQGKNPWMLRSIEKIYYPRYESNSNGNDINTERMEYLVS